MKAWKSITPNSAENDCRGFSPGALRFQAFAARPHNNLYSTSRPREQQVKAFAIPYALWENRGTSEMEMFFPVHD